MNKVNKEELVSQLVQKLLHCECEDGGVVALNKLDVCEGCKILRLEIASIS